LPIVVGFWKQTKSKQNTEAEKIYNQMVPHSRREKTYFALNAKSLRRGFKFGWVKEGRENDYVGKRTQKHWLEVCLRLSYASCEGARSWKICPPFHFILLENGNASEECHRNFLFFYALTVSKRIVYLYAIWTKFHSRTAVNYRQLCSKATLKKACLPVCL